MAQAETLAVPTQSNVYGMERPERVVAETMREPFARQSEGIAIFPREDVFETSPRQSEKDFTYRPDVRARYSAQMERTPGPAELSPNAATRIFEPIPFERYQASEAEVSTRVSESTSEARRSEFAPPRRYASLENRISADRFERTVRQVEESRVSMERATESSEVRPGNSAVEAIEAERDMPINIDVFA